MDTTLALSIEHLNTQLEELKTLELSDEGIADLFNKVGEVFTSSFNVLRDSIAKIGTKDTSPLALDEQAIRKLDKSKMSKNYVYLLDRQVDIPSGMDTKYIKYVEQSYKLSEAYKDVMQLVEQLRIDIGRVISTPDGLKDSTLFSDKIYINRQKEVQALLNEFGKMRKGHDFTATAAYGDVFNNNNELYQCIDVTRKANNNYNTVNRSKLINNIETTMKYVQELLELTKQGYSKPLVQKIGVAVSMVAEYIESFSATTFNAQLISNALNNTVRQVGELM